MIGAIVLAAGSSTRMGSPKALLRYQRVSFLERILGTIGASSIGDALVVLGSHRDEILSTVRIKNHVYNPDYADGMTTSFQAGIRALPDEATGAMIFLVDHPFVSSETIDELLGRCGARPIIIPVCEGRRGHPVFFSREILGEILLLPTSRGVHTVVRADPQRVLEVAVNDRGVSIDIDTPEQFERWIDRTP